MNRLPALAAPLAPALLLVLFAGWCGSFHGAAGWPAGPAGQAVLLAAALFGAAALADPLRLGRSGRWLLWAAVAAAATSVLASPVPRAGRVALTLLPALLLLPAGLARSLAGPTRRDRGLAAWAVAVGGVAVWALLARPLEAGARAALPLGHHNLLAAFLAITLPPLAAGLARRGTLRWISAAALATGLAAIVATRSWLGGFAAVATALAVARAVPRARRLAAGAALIGLGLLVPRLDSMLRGSDASASARSVYARAGWAAILERPGLGWGPGSTPWTLADWLEPRPGVNPPGEVVATLHSSALELAYEIGIPGTLLAGAAALLFGWRRLRDLRAPRAGQDALLTECGLLGLAAGAVMACGNSMLAVPAIPVAIAATAGATLAGCGAAPTGGRRLERWVVAVYLVVAAAALIGPARAERAYDSARRAPRRAEAAEILARAVALDPTFPLYRAREAWASPAAPSVRAVAAVAAATGAHGVAALWIRAGELALESLDYESARACFRRGMALDPLGGVAPFSLFLASGGNAVDCAARAFAAEPRLLAAVHWRQAPESRAAALARLSTWPGLPEGFASGLADRAGKAEPGDGEPVDLGLQMDTTPALAVSLHQFRRDPWPADLSRIRLDRDAVRALAGIPSAAAMPQTGREAFPKERCAPLPR